MDDNEPEQPGWLASLVHINSRPGYLQRYAEIPKSSLIKHILWNSEL